jgi:hypothetical protein
MNLFACPKFNRQAIRTGDTSMKSKALAQRETSTVPAPVVSKLASAGASLATHDDVIADSQIREFAYKLYEERRRVDGYDLQDWFEAESVLRERGKLAA